MSRERTLVLCLCIEDPNNCDVLLSQIGAGHVFGPNQSMFVMLQGNDAVELEALKWNILDCTFPLISGVSTHASLNGLEHQPDLVLVLLADRADLEGAGSKQMADLVGLVQYSTNLQAELSHLALGKTPIVLLGDQAHTAASLVSSDLVVGPDQVLALDGAKVDRTSVTKSCGHLSKASRFCDALSRWWIGAKTNPQHELVLGAKFIATRQLSGKRQNSGYFFSAPVHLRGPMTFTTTPDVDLNSAHVSQVKANTDAAHEIADRFGQQTTPEGQSHCFSSYMAHL